MNLLPQNLELLDLIPALAIITGGLIIGLIIQIIILVRIRQLFKKTKFTYDDRLVNSLGNSPIIYSLLAAIYIASFTLDIPQDGLNLLKQFLIVISLVELTIIVSRISGISVEVYLRKVSGDSSASLFTNAARILVYIVGFLIISQTLGINITAALTALGV
ncbi:hypothetical protein KC678_04855, partial [Candidatus Dojkabacteria bacterium]|nr:hypothetical protein [Candidatus Dojkabacteria bacterium]